MDLVSKEEVVRVLLDELVEPHLPKRIPAGDPPVDKQHSVAKQLHGVVLLYNYYHRKQCPQAEFLDFESFCKLAVTLKPVLAWHMNCKSQSDSAQMNDCEKQLSITEKAIQDACDLSFMLDASKTNPDIEGWEISKVSVLLLDSKKENCFLMFGSVNDGVWSVLEKNLKVSTSDSKLDERKHVNKKRRVTKPVASEPKTSDSSLQQLAFLAVQDITGIRRSDLVVLEKHVVYSLSKAKTTSCFYIIQCSRPTSQDFQIPVKDVIKSLQGPLVEKNSGGCFTTPVVEYFHLLPYAPILSAWHSGDIIPSTLQSSLSRSPKDAENTSETEVSENEIPSPKMRDASIKMPDCSDNNCSNMVCETNEDYDTSTTYKKSSGKEVENEIVSSEVGDTSIEMSDCLDNNCSNMVCELNEDAKSSGKEEVGNEIASLKMGDASIKTTDCLDNNCSNMGCETNEDYDSTDYAKSSGKEEVGNEIASLKMGDASIKKTDCLDNNCSNMVCEINEDYDSTDYAKSSGKEEVGNEIASLKMGDASIKTTDCLDNNCSNMGCEINEDYNSTDYAKSSGEEIENEIASSKMGDTSIKMSDCLDNNCSNMVCEINEVYDRSTDYAKSSGKELGNEVASLKMGDTSIKVSDCLDNYCNNMASEINENYDRSNNCEKSSVEEVGNGFASSKMGDTSIKTSDCLDNHCNNTTELAGEEMFSASKVKSLTQALYKKRVILELDVLCRANNWKLPTYAVSYIHGGFRIKVVVQGLSFECFCESDLHSDSIEATESAAAKMNSKLQTMSDLVVKCLTV